MSGAALTVEGGSLGANPSLIPVDVLVEDMEVHSVGRMWNSSYHGVALGFYPLTFGGERMIITNKIEIIGMTLHDSGKHPGQAFAGCHGANPPRGMGAWHPVPCVPANLTGLSGNVTVSTPQPMVCSKANLGAAGKNLKVACVSV